MLCLQRLSGDDSIKLTEWNRFIEPVDSIDDLDYWIDRLVALNKNYTVASYRVHLSEEDVACKAITNYELESSKVLFEKELVYPAKYRGLYFRDENKKIIYISKDGIDLIKDKSKTVYAIFSNEGDLLED